MKTFRRCSYIQPWFQCVLTSHNFVWMKTFPHCSYIQQWFQCVLTSHNFVWIETFPLCSYIQPWYMRSIFNVYLRIKIFASQMNVENMRAAQYRPTAGEALYNLKMGFMSYEYIRQICYYCMIEINLYILSSPKMAFLNYKLLILCVFCWFDLWFNFPATNFSVMLGQSHHFLGIHQNFWE